MVEILLTELLFVSSRVSFVLSVWGGRRIHLLFFLFFCTNIINYNCPKSMLIWTTCIERRHPPISLIRIFKHLWSRGYEVCVCVCVCVHVSIYNSWFRQHCYGNEGDKHLCSITSHKTQLWNKGPSGSCLGLSEHQQRVLLYWWPRPNSCHLMSQLQSTEVGRDHEFAEIGPATKCYDIRSSLLKESLM